MRHDPLASSKGKPGMTGGRIAGASFATTLVVLVLAARERPLEQSVDAAAASSLPRSAPTAPAQEDGGQGSHGLLYGRVTTEDGLVYQGRLRWGRDEEALWGNDFNGFKDDNPWLAHAPPKRRSIEVFGIELAAWERRIDGGRPFMARFGDIARIEPRGRDIRVVLKSGTAFDLDRFSADDLADGLRVWDDAHGVVDLGEWEIRTIELLPTPRLVTAPYPLHGTVRTREGTFTGLVQWDREACLVTDELEGHTAAGALSLRFDTIRSIARSRDSSLVTLLDGREIVLSGTREVGDGNRGVYVDDPRYGRVLISWDAFERVDFSPGGTGPAYGDFRPGRPLTGSVTTRSGRRLAGRLVYDLDESETSETLDAPARGVDYSIRFGLVASIVVPAGREEGGDQLATVVLQGGEALQLERSGDLGEGNAGVLIFTDGDRNPEYVPWADVRQIDFGRAPAADSPRGFR